MKLRRYFIVITFLEAFIYSSSCGIVSSPSDHTACNQPGDCQVLHVTGGEDIKIYDTDANYSPTTLAQISDNKITVHHETIDFNYDTSDSDRESNVDIGYKPASITISWTQNSTPLQLTFALSETATEEFIYSISIEPGEIVYLDQDVYPRVRYGTNGIILDIPYEVVTSIRGRFQGTLNYTVETQTINYRSINCTPIDSTVWDVLYECDDGQTNVDFGLQEPGGWHSTSTHFTCVSLTDSFTYPDVEISVTY